MKAVVITTPGGPDVLQLQEVEDPEIGDDRSPHQSRGHSPQQDRHSPAQRIVSTDEGREPIPGSRMFWNHRGRRKKTPLGGKSVIRCVLLTGGGYAEKVAVHAAQVLPVPAGVSLKDAATFPEGVCTIWSTVFMMSRLSEGETFLIHGGSSGIGTYAIQIAKYKGAKVFVTAGSEDKLAACKDLGADVCINYKTQDFVARVKEETQGKGVDFILDNIGGPYF